MMKYFKYILSIVCCVLVVSACDSIDFGNVNNDDDNPTQPNTKSLMASAMNRYFTLGGRPYIAIPSLLVQYQSQITYTSEQRYSVVPYGWGGYYVQTLSNLRKVIEVNSADDVDQETKTYGAPANQIGVAKLMSAYIWKQLTDTYGPVPYKEALSEDTITPAYTSQEEIYMDLFKEVKDARDMLNADLLGPTGDVVYGGNVTKWKKFANSFLMTLALQISEVNPDKGKTEFQAALNDPAGVIDEVSEEFWYDFQNMPGATNAFSTLRGADYQMALPATEALRGDSKSVTYNGKPVIEYSNDSYDARLNVYAATPSNNGRPYGRGSLQGDPSKDGFNAPEGLTGSYTSINTAITGGGSTLPYMTAAYTYLNRADAANRGWTSENAQEMLTKGIMMSYKTIDSHWDDGSPERGLLQTDGAAFAAERLDDAPMTQLIGEEKWAALFPMGFQEWAEWRRTDIPDLVPAVDALNDGSIQTRYIYPNDESSVNSESYKGGVDQLNPAEDSNTAKVWWDQ